MRNRWPWLILPLLAAVPSRAAGGAHDVTLA